ncbi:glycosyltransferase [Candidatus Methylomirabilis sp.]|uniref:glycosyltransferase n=1 Tax=Candidatus Methylomirabilis sp. TaxID=2032687 RepID=UPI00307609C7
MSEGKLALSVIVPSYNAASTIEACLMSLINQDVKDPYEIIVVDSSEDNTPRIISEKFPSVHLIHFNERTFAQAARARGLRHASGEFVAMVDADCVASPDWLAKLLDRHRNGNYAAVGGALQNGTPWSLTGTIGYLSEFSRQLPSARKELTRTLVAGNVCYRRDVLEPWGIPEDLDGGEDVLINWRLCKSGWAMLFDQEIQVTHFNKTGLMTVLGYHHRLGRFGARCRRIEPDLPGSIFLKHPFLGISLPLVRLLLVTGRLISYRDWKNLAIVWLALPWFMTCATVWALGFIQEATSEHRSLPA